MLVIKVGGEGGVQTCGTTTSEEEVSDGRERAKRGRVNERESRALRFSVCLAFLLS